MDRIEVDNVINTSIRDNETRDILPVSVRASLAKMLDFVQENLTSLATKEDISNKATDLSNPDDTKYPTTLAVDTAFKLSDNADNIGHVYMLFYGDPKYSFADESSLADLMYQSVGGNTEQILLKYDLHPSTFSASFNELVLTIKLRYQSGIFDTGDHSAEKQSRYTTLNFDYFFSDLTNLYTLKMDFHPGSMKNMLSGCTSLTHYINTNSRIITSLPALEMNRNKANNAYNAAGGTGGPQPFIEFCDPAAYFIDSGSIQNYFGSTPPTFPYLSTMTAGYIKNGLSGLVASPGLPTSAIFNSLVSDPTDDSGGGVSVDSVTGLNTDNTDPANPIVKISVDGTTITGDGTPGSPLVGAASGAVIDDVTPSSTKVYSSQKTMVEIDKVEADQTTLKIFKASNYATL